MAPDARTDPGDPDDSARRPPGDVTHRHPKLRDLDPKWIEHEGKDYLYLRDPLSLSDDNVLVPAPLVPLLALCDGTRDLEAVRAGFALRTGVRLDDDRFFGLFDRLESACLLDGPTYRTAAAAALDAYRAAPHRPPSHSGAVYPEDPSGLRDMVADFCESAPIVGMGAGGGAGAGTDRLVGMLSPHIDYARGGATYAAIWQAAAPDLNGIELVIVLGTDHSGGPAALTLTRQDYATPLGTLPTSTDVVDSIAEAVGDDRAFAEELHHRSEHSVELAVVWMHAFMEARRVALVPVLCGSFAEIIAGDIDPQQDARLNRAIDAMAAAAAARPTLVIAAGDLAHVGPVFGDPSPVAPAARHALGLHDEESLAAICEGDAEGFLSLSVEEKDRRRICGLSAIYLMLEVLRRAHGGPVSGISMGYDQCPADAGSDAEGGGGSLVSIAGALLYA